MAKIEKKNNSIEALKMTIDNLEKHTEAYTKKLRDYGKELKCEIKRVEDIKQMEIEDLMSRLVLYEFRYQEKELEFVKIELAYKAIKPSLEEKDATIDQLNGRLEDEEEKTFSLNNELRESKEQLELKEKENHEHYAKNKKLEDDNINLKSLLEGNLI
jgi:chromosome segregation ATPase